jgi:long-chain acyl-CoA synthetase
MLAAALSKPHPRAVGERRHQSEWTWLSSTELKERSEAVAYALRDAGMGRGERAAILSQNRIDWLVADFGILFAGCVVVPIFATIAADQLAFILEDADVRLVFAETAELAAAARGARPGVRVVVFEPGESRDADSFEAFTERGAALRERRPDDLSGFTEGLSPSDLGVLIYTSGTTGNPKGVMLLHSNLASNARDACDYLIPELQWGEPTLSVLPFSHIYEHCMMLAALRRGFEYAITIPDFLLRDLQEIRPRSMPLVPRIFERVLTGIVSKARNAGGLQAKLVPWALETGRRRSKLVCEGKAVPSRLALEFAVAQRLVLSKVKPRMGLDRLMFFMSGSAPLHPDISYTYKGLGIEICEGYGLTETSPVICTNRPFDNKIGTVGKPIPNVEVKIAEDGELLARGPNVMKGYYRAEEQPFDEDGWFKTGDIGEIDAEGYVKITDRKKELFKTSGGKYIAPARVESALKRSPYFSQAIVMGYGRPYPIALIAPNWDLLRAELHLPEGADTAGFLERADVRAFIAKEVARQTDDLAPFEQIRHFSLLPRELTIEQGEMSPSLKLKRRVIEARFAQLIDRAYHESQPAAG